MKRDPPRAYYAAVAMAVLSVARSEGPSGKESIRVVNLGDPSQPIALEPRDVPEPMQPIVKELILVGGT